MKDAVILQSKVYRWTVMICLIGYPVFVASIVLFPFLLLLCTAAFLAVLVYEVVRRDTRKNWLRFLCLSWLILSVPSFGVMPLLIAWRLHFFLPLGNRLGIFIGFTLTAIYNFFIPVPELYEVDHPFPPLTFWQLHLLGCSTLLLSVLPAGLLVRRGLWKFRPHPRGISS
jgi:hypothetical protein